uniref:Metallophos domain-containing protein n=1 Tax=Rhabditophanes sp. KR3021 TaxID=114890 RepID=A0AC35U892_9BILA
MHFDYFRKTSRRASLGVIGLRRDSMLSGKEGNSILPNEVVIKIHQYTDDPSMAWEMLKSTTPVRPVRQMKLDTPVRNDAVRFVSVACTYGVFLDPKKIPPGDVLLICGDFTSCGLPQEVKGFNDNLALLKHPFKIVIAGNHECTFDESFMKMAASRHMDVKEGALKHALNAAMAASKITNPKSLLTNCIYLQDNLVELFGLKIYGTPWQPKNDKWAFNLNRGQPLLDKWNLIPSGIDVLLTHAAPLGHGDLMVTGNRAGCVELLNSVVKRIRPAYHVYGHIHEGYGCSSDGYTKFINCSIVNENLEPTNTPVIFDIAVNHEIKSSFIRNAKKIVKKVNKS